MRYIVRSLLIISLIATVQSCERAGSADSAIEQQNNNPSPPPPPPPSPTGNALLGGGNTSAHTPLAYTMNVGSLNDPTPISGITAKGEIYSVSINLTGDKGLLGGSESLTSTPFAYTVDVLNSTATAISGIASKGSINSVAISELGTFGFIGGDDGASHPIAYNVDIASSTAVAISPLPTVGSISAVAVNSNGDIGLMGGADLITVTPFAFRVKSNTATDIPLAGATGSVSSVAIDQNGINGLLGLDITPAVPAFVLDLPTTTADPVIFTTTPDEIHSVAMNRSGTIGLIGGILSNNAAAYVVDIATKTAQEITDLETDAQINSVALDSAGKMGLFGGNTFTTNTGIAYVVNLETNTLTQVTGLPANSNIESVEIQDSGLAGIIAGSADLNSSLEEIAVAFLLPDLFTQPSMAIQLNLSGTMYPGGINSVSVDGLSDLLNHIPTVGLSGNNLKLANYLNENASDTASYFIPAYLEGTLDQALESIAPTRNATSLFALSNNFFTFIDGITQRGRNARQEYRSETIDSQELSYLASLDDGVSSDVFHVCPRNTLWVDLIGFNAYQDSQNQTPRFHPMSIGFLIGYDFAKTSRVKIGTSVGYMYTHVNQSNDQGFSHIHQEFASLYSLWSYYNFFANSALSLGYFQLNNYRDMHITEFDFHVHSYRRGLQFDPHLEFGYDYNFWDCNYTLEPFVMADWLHNWQMPSQEFGDHPFRFVQQYLHSSMLRAETGFRFYEKFQFCSWNLVLQENLSYLYRKPFSIGDVKGFLVGAPGTLILETFTSAEHLGSAGIVFLFEPKSPCYPSGTVAYKAEFGSGYQSHLITLSSEWSF